MADKFPLIANTSAQQIQEISSGDNLNLLGNSIVGVVSVTSSGNVSVGGTLSVTENASVGGTLSVTGNVSVGGTLTYEDVTNIDSVGIITARTGIKVLAGGINAVGVVSDSKGSLRNIPQNQQLGSSNYTLVASDAGKYIALAGSPGGLTIPTGVFSAGDAVTIINGGTSDQTITCSALTTYLAGDTSAKSSLTLKGRGMATFLFHSGTVCYGSGAGLE
tara:strand:- start:68 stop:724 length:657 start_codon:yes stop_codon:yes gene_type:complete